MKLEVIFDSEDLGFFFKSIVVLLVRVLAEKVMLTEESLRSAFIGLDFILEPRSDPLRIGTRFPLLERFF